MYKKVKALSAKTIRENLNIDPDSAKWLNFVTKAIKKDDNILIMPINLDILQEIVNLEALVDLLDPIQSKIYSQVVKYLTGWDNEMNALFTACDAEWPKPDYKTIFKDDDLQFECYPSTAKTKREANERHNVISRQGRETIYEAKKGHLNAARSFRNHIYSTILFDMVDPQDIVHTVILCSGVYAYLDYDLREIYRYKENFSLIEYGTHSRW